MTETGFTEQVYIQTCRSWQRLHKTDLTVYTNLWILIIIGSCVHAILCMYKINYKYPCKCDALKQHRLYDSCTYHCWRFQVYLCGQFDC